MGKYLGGNMKRILSAFFFTASLSARVIVVPDSVSTIQGGLNLARSGDTVLVKPGEYRENITWPSTDGIKLYSSAGPDSTRINAGGNGRVIYFPSLLTRATEIQGFTITGGKSNFGAGIYTSGSPSIIGNKIQFNTCSGGRDYGAGIYCYSGTSPLIVKNEISHNTCSDTSTWNYGGGIFVATNSTAEIGYNLIANNTCSRGYWNYGAGIYVDLRASPVIYQNVIRANVNTLGDRGHGAGICVGTQGNALIFSNLITENQNTSGSWNYGGGIMSEGKALIINNTIANNLCAGGNWAYGGGVYNTETAFVKNNIIVQNTSSRGSGIYNTGTVFNSNNDIWNNPGGNYYGCSPGAGEISQDPLFVSGPRGPYYLSQIGAGQPVNSPCVDAGDTLLATSPLKLDSLLRSWTTRTDSIPDFGVLDMGYHYPRERGYLGLEARELRPKPQIKVTPNPFSTYLIFSFPNLTGFERIQIADIFGQVLYRSSIDPKARNFLWDGSDNSGRPLPTGLYLYRIETKERDYFGHLIKVDK